MRALGSLVYPTPPDDQPAARAVVASIAVPSSTPLRVVAPSASP
ncbi:hypothetical protein AZ54_24400 [Xanthomonas oryzae pv. oryzae PXO86]|uniref:Uncharacterized protein n=1 Tax=Xanthomonas oryzae pv. oryzae (strain KACC10331 / KXO85) TaxID=291331 RepID=Q05HP7_XANOR|nr:hypothetical protein [Xanthomonas oryzae]ABJ90055.1 hypothetical protein XOO4956 [Xanthomonas oryzae pv. oryzae KACC 10331]AJQ85318.1 hypothetical protein AZ54_24400 [Xanthomonas oryzae pv. oryzae PXO86]